MNEKLQAQIDKCGAGPTKGDKWWYTPIDFGNGCKTHRIGMSDRDFYRDPSYGLNKWHNYIHPYLPIRLEGKTVLDVGCNCGLFCIQAVREGAAKVVGIEGDPGNNGFYDQSQLVLDTFSEVDGVDYRAKVEIVNCSVEQYSWELFGEVDLAFAFNVFYWMDEPNYVSERISQLSDHLFILGQEDNARKYASMKDIAELLEGRFNIIKQFVPKVKGGRKFNVTIARSIHAKN